MIDMGELPLEEAVLGIMRTVTEWSTEMVRMAHVVELQGAEIVVLKQRVRALERGHMAED